MLVWRQRWSLWVLCIVMCIAALWCCRTARAVLTSWLMWSRPLWVWLCLPSASVTVCIYGTIYTFSVFITSYPLPFFRSQFSWDWSLCLLRAKSNEIKNIISESSESLLINPSKWVGFRHITAVNYIPSVFGTRLSATLNVRCMCTQNLLGLPSTYSLKTEFIRFFWSWFCEQSDSIYRTIDRVSRLAKYYTNWPTFGRICVSSPHYRDRFVLHVTEYAHVSVYSVNERVILWTTRQYIVSK